jgi:hypothetical protein
MSSNDNRDLGFVGGGFYRRGVDSGTLQRLRRAASAKMSKSQLRLLKNTGCEVFGLVAYGRSWPHVSQAELELLKQKEGELLSQHEDRPKVERLAVLYRRPF